MFKERIDIHCHLVPDFWAEQLPDHGGDPSGWIVPEWSAEKHIRYMDNMGIQTSIVSLTAPGIEGWKGAERVEMAVKVNDYGAALVKKNPQRFGYLATLPLPDVEATLKEIKRSYDQLNVDGVVLHSNFDDVYLGDKVFDPIWQELENRKAVVFFHPTTPAGVKVLPGQPSPFEDYPADTTKCALDLFINGHLTRFPSVKIVLSHGGGFLPYAASRFAEIATMLRKGKTSDQLYEELRNFYFDTALVGASGYPSLIKFARPDRILYGSDFPYCPERTARIFTSALDNESTLSDAAVQAVNTTARSFFPRLS